MTVRVKSKKMNKSFYKTRPVTPPWDPSSVINWIQTTPSLEHKGMIVQKKEDGKLPQVLLVPDITEDDFEHESDLSIKKLAQDKGGTTKIEIIETLHD